MFDSLPIALQKSLRANLQDVSLRSHDLSRLSRKKWRNFLSSWSSAHLEKVQSIDLGDTDLKFCDRTALDSLICWIHSCENLLSINLQDNYIGEYVNDSLNDDDLMDFVDRLLRGCKKLQHINISYNSLKIINNMGSYKWQSFCQALATCENLQSIDLRGNNLFELRDVDMEFGYVGFIMNPWKILFESLAKCKKLQIMDLNNNNLGDFDHEEWKFISKHLPKQLTTIKCELMGDLKFILDENGICKYANILYDKKNNCLTNKTYNHPAFKRKVLCFMQHAIVQPLADYRGVGFFVNKGFYDQLAPYLSYKDAENMELALPKPTSKPVRSMLQRCKIM